jgi:hypothetical protein
MLFVDVNWLLIVRAVDELGGQDGIATDPEEW